MQYSSILYIITIKELPYYLIASLLLISCSKLAYAQSNNHWARSFNEESSLLAGAVVGGGAGPSAIYYNPSGISEITESKLSLHASLFSFKFFNIRNGLGNGIDLRWNTVQIEPRFLSYMIKPKNQPGWSVEFAFLNNENYHIDVAKAIDYEADVLRNEPGMERYYATVKFRNNYRDDWIGIGWSVKASPRLFLGASMFVSIKSLNYTYDLDIEAYNIDSVQGAALTDLNSANYQESETLKYNDYRVLWKFGVLYTRERFSIGACITTPSAGGIYSDGKRISRKIRQSGISSPESGEALPDYFVGDYKEGKDVRVNHKSPFSAALGFTRHSPDKERVWYATAEYFAGLAPYRIASAKESQNIASGILLDIVDMNEWLSFVSGANPVLNAAIGYQWKIDENLLLMTGFRTDFNYMKNFDYGSYPERKSSKTIGVDNYHFSGGLTWNVLGQDIITGAQYTLGLEKEQKQIINLSEPVEFNLIEKAPLQGARNNNMSTFINGLSIYIGATFNFGGEPD